VDVGTEQAGELHQRECQFWLSKLETDCGCMAVTPTTGRATWGWLSVKREAGRKRPATHHCVVLFARNTLNGPFLLFEVNHRPESRMREIRQSGSEGGGAEQSALPTPIGDRKPLGLTGGTPALVRLQAHMVREVKVLLRHTLSGL
jgi:hypothetical protein